MAELTSAQHRWLDVLHQLPLGDEFCSKLIDHYKRGAALELVVVRVRAGDAKVELHVIDMAGHIIGTWGDRYNQLFLLLGTLPIKRRHGGVR